MRKTWLLALTGLLLAGGAWADDNEAKPALPKTLDELKQRHEEAGKDPKAVLKLWFDACFVYMNEDTRDEGRAMVQYLTIPLKDEPQWDRAPSEHYFLEALLEKTWIIRSYAKGTSPGNQYQMDPNDYELNIERVNDKHPAGLQVYLRSSGADMPRPVYMKRSTKTGLWFVDGHRNVYVPIRPPQDPDQEHFE